MKYDNIKKGRFIERPNRFIAYAYVDGKKERVHVKNTGRCKEILLPDAEVYLTKSDNPDRKTAYDLVGVRKEHRLINIDSQAPNKVVGEYLADGRLFDNIRMIRPETTYGNSRFDFYVETEDEKIFIEVKGVTLERDNYVYFPDAPSDRAVKHVEELIQAKRDGYRVFVCFVIQMKDVLSFSPNSETHPEFADALCKAAQAGVEILAFDCNVTEDSLQIADRVEVDLKKTLRPGNIFAISKPLLSWYDGNRRRLPWREIPTAYRVWVSEIMLQQTRVEAVKPYFERFMETLPDIQSLAQADEETLLKLWEGLGYYNRVRNLQKAAIQICESYEAKMPEEYEELLKLQGIGSYTAGAIASIAFGKKVPAVDGNVLRVLSRYRMDDRNILDAKVKASVEDDLKEAMPSDRPGDFNQAMMEIGACVCIPNGAPHCDLCPLAEKCMARLAGKMMDFPKKESKTARRIENKTVLIIQDENKTALHKRDNKGLLAGMYEFPMTEGHLTADEVVLYLEERGIKTLRIQPLKAAKHIFSHIEWHMVGYVIRVDELEKTVGNLAGDEWVYIEPTETKEKYPIPSAFSAYTKILKIKQGKTKFEEEN